MVHNAPKSSCSITFFVSFIYTDMVFYAAICLALKIFDLDTLYHYNNARQLVTIMPAALPYQVIHIVSMSSLLSSITYTDGIILPIPND